MREGQVSDRSLLSHERRSNEVLKDFWLNGTLNRRLEISKSTVAQFSITGNKFRNYFDSNRRELLATFYERTEEKDALLAGTSLRFPQNQNKKSKPVRGKKGGGARSSLRLYF